MIAGTARRRDTSVRMRGSTPGPAPSECHDIVFQDGARSQGVHLQRDLRLAEVNACMPRVSATSNQDTMGRHLWVERGNSVWVVCFAQEFDSARVKVLAFATWYALVCENRTDDNTWRADVPVTAIHHRTVSRCCCYELLSLLRVALVRSCSHATSPKKKSNPSTCTRL